MPPKTHRERLVALLQKYEPSKVPSVDNLLKTFPGKEEALIKKLVKQLGPEPEDAAPPKSTPTDAASPPAKPPGKKGMKKVPGKKAAASPEASPPSPPAASPEASPSPEATPSPPAASPGKKKSARKKVPVPPVAAASPPASDPKSPTAAAPDAKAPPKPSPKGKKGMKRPAKAPPANPNAPAPSAPSSIPPTVIGEREMVALEAESPSPITIEGSDPHGLRMDRAVTEASLATGTAAMVGTQPSLPLPLLALRPTRPYSKLHRLAPSVHTLRREALLRTLSEFYEVVAPDRVGKIDLVVESFENDELRLFSQLEAKYRNGADADEEGARGESEAGTVGRLSAMSRRPGTASAAALASKSQLGDGAKSSSGGSGARDSSQAPPAGLAALIAAESSTPPVYPFGHLQKRFNANLVQLSAVMVYREQIFKAYCQLDAFEQFEAARGDGYEGTLTDFEAAPMASERETEIYTEIDTMLNSHPNDEASVVSSVYQNLASLYEEVGEEVPSHLVAGNMTTEGSDVWLEVATVASNTAKEEDEWDAKLTDYLVKERVKRERTGIIQRGAERKGAEPPAAVRALQTADRTAADNATNYSNNTYVGAPMTVVDPTTVHQKDADVWRMVHLRHRKLRRSLFCGEVLADVPLPTGMTAANTIRRHMKGHVDGSPAAASAEPTLANAHISTGYASTCDVTPRQQVQAIVMKYCPERAPLVLPALWQYRGREHLLIQRLHTLYGVDDRAAGDRIRLSRKQAEDGDGPDGVGGSDGDPFMVAPRVGSEHYLADVMHGQVCGISKEIEVDSNLIVKSATSKATTQKYPVTGAVQHMPSFAYPCEDASFRSWSNIPPSLQAVASMARHYGLGPQFVHQLHAQNPLDPDACAYELLCFLFPDAVYACLSDDEQRLAFMAKRTAEFMSFVKKVDPRFTRPQPGAPPGGLRLTDKPLNAGDAIPRLLQKYSPLATQSDFEYERLEEEAARTKPRFARKPAKERSVRLDGGSSAYNDDNEREAGVGDLQLQKNNPERALADAFTQHFGELMDNVQQHSMRWADLYRYATPARHNEVLSSIDRWIGAFGPLPSAEVITLDIMRTAKAAAAEAKALRELMEAKESAIRREAEDRDVQMADDRSSSEVAASTPGASHLDAPLFVGSDGLVVEPASSGPPIVPTQSAPLFTSSGASLHMSTQFMDPKGGLNSRHSRLLEVPSLAHRYVCQKLTRSTPYVYDSVIKPYLKDTREVATMTHHAEEALITGMLFRRENGTSTTLDTIGKVAVRGAWPPEGMEDRLSAMPLAQLRKLRHKVLFGDRPDSYGGTSTTEDGRAPEATKRMSYKRRLDPERAARREHNKLYFGAQYGSDDDSDTIHNGEDDNSQDAVFGRGADASRAHPNTTYPRPFYEDVQSVIEGDSREEYWFDQPIDAVSDVQDWDLAERTTGRAVVALVRKYRHAQSLLATANGYLQDASSEIDRLQLRCANGVQAPASVGDTFSGRPTPNSFHTSRLDRNGSSCGRCEALEGRVRALMDRLHEVRHGKGSLGVESVALQELLADMSNESTHRAVDRALPPTPPYDDASLFQNPNRSAARQHTLSLLDML